MPMAGAPLSPPCRFSSARYSAAKIGTFLLCSGSRLSSSQLPKCGRVGFIGEGVWGARERDFQRLPCAAFFGYFLVRTQESNTYRQNDKSQFILPFFLFNFSLIPSERVEFRNRLCYNAHNYIMERECLCWNYWHLPDQWMP